MVFNFSAKCFISYVHTLNDWGINTDIELVVHQDRSFCQNLNIRVCTQNYLLLMNGFGMSRSSETAFVSLISVYFVFFVTDWTALIAETNDWILEMQQAEQEHTQSLTHMVFFWNQSINSDLLISIRFPNIGFCFFIVKKSSKKVFLVARDTIKIM